MNVRMLLFVVLLSVSPFSGRCAAIDVLFPAYANPCCDGGPLMWSSLIETARDRRRMFELHVIFNPASGPGIERDPNYVDASGNGPLKDLKSAGGIIHGYVGTRYGTRPLEDIKADVDAYFTGHYAGFVDGIFFDEMSNDLANTGYYAELQDYVKSLQATARTFGNPGTPYTENPSGQTEFTAEDYIDSLDTIITIENTDAVYMTEYRSFPYLEDLHPHKIGHIIHSRKTWDAGLLKLAAERGAGFLYVTDDVMPPNDNPYDAIPGYWGQFTSDVSSFNKSEFRKPPSRRGRGRDGKRRESRGERRR
ncbi:MAG: spherulation-specific family 4 protein [Planctomycetaceae bacterium]